MTRPTPIIIGTERISFGRIFAVLTEIDSVQLQSRFFTSPEFTEAHAQDAAKAMALAWWLQRHDTQDAAEIERLRDALRSTVENLENMNIGSAQWVKAAFDVAAAGRAVLRETKE